MITGISTFANLLENPSLASLYTSIRRSETATGSELVETTTISKKTVYDYLHKLEQAGLISKVDDDGGTAVYTAEEFEVTLTVRETEVSITPELIEVIAQKNEYPAIERVLEDYDIVTFALTYDLVKAHSEGNVTIRQIASLTDLSPGATYDLVEALYSILELGDDESPPTTYSPDNFDEDEGDLFREFAISRPSDEHVHYELCGDGDVSEPGERIREHFVSFATQRPGGDFCICDRI